MRTLVLVMTMFVMTTFGGMITVGVSADTPTEDIEEVAVEEVIDEVAEEEVIEDDVEEVEAVEEENENNDEQYNKYCKEDTPKGIIEEQTGLTVDYIQTIDSYGSWGAYYCHCDGDLYCITIDEGVVGVCVILN